MNFILYPGQIQTHTHLYPNQHKKHTHNTTLSSPTHNHTTPVTPTCLIIIKHWTRDSPKPQKKKSNGPDLIIISEPPPQSNYLAEILTALAVTVSTRTRTRTRTHTHRQTETHRNRKEKIKKERERDIKSEKWLSKKLRKCLQRKFADASTKLLRYSIKQKKNKYNKTKIKKKNS